MNFKKIEINTVAKVGSSDFLDSCKKIYPTIHKHSLLRLKRVLKNKKDTLIIVGIRNPIDRNLSYFFQTYNDNFYNTVKTKLNNYKGEYNYVKEIIRNKLKNVSTERLIKIYFNMHFHNTFNDWFTEFFEITHIDKIGFDIEKGLQLYDLPNNNTIMMYTLEKLNNNKDEICKILKIPVLLHTNDSNTRHYKKIYNNVKEKIVYKKEYLDNLLNTDIMKFFYSESDIKAMYNKYITM